MAYEYESITNGMFSFTIPGENKTVKLFRGSRVVVQTQLTGSYLRVLQYIGEVKDTEISKETTKPKAKIEDKITAVAETVEVPVVEEVTVTTEDVISEVKEEVTAPTPAKKRRK